MDKKYLPNSQYGDSIIVASCYYGDDDDDREMLGLVLLNKNAPFYTLCTIYSDTGEYISGGHVENICDIMREYGEWCGIGV